MKFIKRDKRKGVGFGFFFFYIFIQSQYMNYWKICICTHVNWPQKNCFFFYIQQICYSSVVVFSTTRWFIYTNSLPGHFFCFRLPLGVCGNERNSNVWKSDSFGVLHFLNKWLYTANQLLNLHTFYSPWSRHILMLGVTLASNWIIKKEFCVLLLYGCVWERKCVCAWEL